MKASELRIGNYVSLHGILVEMTASDFNFDESYFKPIPLTEKWLLKFGFEYSSFYGNYKIKAGNYSNSIKLYEGEWCYYNDDSDAGCYFVTTIKYVHQLQNLYFALTNEELTYEQQK